MSSIYPSFTEKLLAVGAVPWRAGKEGTEYFAGLGGLVTDDPQVRKLALEIVHLANPLSAPFDEPLRSRVAAKRRS